MALLHYLNAHAEEGGYRVKALNVEHGIRGAASERDSAFVRDYCEKNQIPLLFYAVRAREWAEKEKVGLEEAARTLRYACFRDALDGGACDLIALAHHAGRSGGNRSDESPARGRAERAPAEWRLSTGRSSARFCTCPNGN